jgi:hypothetical protein
MLVNGSHREFSDLTPSACALRPRPAVRLLPRESPEHLFQVAEHDFHKPLKVPEGHPVFAREELPVALACVGISKALRVRIDRGECPQVLQHVVGNDDAELIVHQRLELAEKRS